MFFGRPERIDAISRSLAIERRGNHVSLKAQNSATQLAQMILNALKAVTLLPSILACSIFAESAIQDSTCAGVIHGVVYERSGQPAVAFRVTADPIGVDMGAFLPTTISDQNGVYRFEHLCAGKYAVAPEDPSAGYPFVGAYVYEFLFGARPKDAKLTRFHNVAELPVQLPAQPGRLLLRVRDSLTGSEIMNYSATLRVPGQRLLPELRFQHSINVVDEVNIPPGKTFTLEVTAEKYKALPKSISVPSGSEATIELSLEPLD